MRKLEQGADELGLHLVVDRALHHAACVVGGRDDALACGEQVGQLSPDLRLETLAVDRQACGGPDEALQLAIRGPRGPREPGRAAGRLDAK